MSTISYGSDGASTAEQPPGFIGQCEKLNALLENGHAVAAKIVGPQIQDEAVAKESDCFASQLECAIERALRDAQRLVEQLNNIARKFYRA